MAPRPHSESTLEAVKKIHLGRLGETAEHEGRGGEIDHGLGVSRLYFVVLGEASEVSEPGESAFDDPALGQDDEAVGMDFFDDLGGERAVARQSRDPVEKTPSVATVDENGFEPAVAEQKRFQQFRSVAVLQSGLMHHATQNQPKGIHQ